MVVIGVRVVPGGVVVHVAVDVQLSVQAAAVSWRVQVVNLRVIGVHVEERS